jgi:hypothetical protein
VIGADGSLFAIRRRPQRPVPNTLIDDIFISLGILLAGYRVVRAPELRACETYTGVWRVLHGERAITCDAREPSVREQRANR